MIPRVFGADSGSMGLSSAMLYFWFQGLLVVAECEVRSSYISDCFEYMQFLYSVPWPTTWF